MGIVDGVMVRCLTCRLDIKKVMISNLHYHKEHNTMTCHNGDALESFKVFDNGTFAEMVKEEKPKEFRVESLGFGYQIMTNQPKETNSSDKELLKECLDMFNKTVFNEDSSWDRDMELAQPLLTKLNKHLNHE